MLPAPVAWTSSEEGASAEASMVYTRDPGDDAVGPSADYAS